MKISKVRDVKTPIRGTANSAGIDFFVPTGIHETLGPGKSCLIPSGIKADVPENHALIAFNKSGVAVKKNLHVGACVVDEDYQGEIHINLTNVGNETVHVESGEKIIQFVLVPVTYEDVSIVDESELFNYTSERGSGGFGSTGTK